MHREKVLVMDYSFISVFCYKYADEEKLAVSRWKITCENME